MEPIIDDTLLEPIKDTDLAWAAGIIDGEGCIALTRSRRTFRLRLYAGNNHPAMSDRLFEIFQLGNQCVSHPHSKPQYIWYASGLEAATALVRVKDFLVIKGAEAEIAIKFAETMIHVSQFITEDIRREREHMANELSLLGDRRRGDK